MLHGFIYRCAYGVGAYRGFMSYGYYVYASMPRGPGQRDNWTAKPGQPCPESTGVGAGSGRPGAYANSRRAPVSTHRGLVRGRLVLVQDPQIFEARGIVAP